MNKDVLFIILILTIVITLLGTIALFNYLGITFNQNNEVVLTRAAFVVTGNNQRQTISL